MLTHPSNFPVVHHRASAMPLDFGLCPVCEQHTLRSSTATRCGECYRHRRGMPSRARPQKHCAKCGAAITKTSTICITCWYNRGQQTDTVPAPGPREPLTTFDDAWAKWGELIGRSKEHYKGPPPSHQVDDITRVCIVPDIHAPFHDEQMLASLIAREADRTDLAVLVGDVADCYSVSRYSKNPFSKVSFEYEWASVSAVVQLLAENFPRIIWVAGNHDKRVSRQIAQHLPSQDWVDVVKAMSGGHLDPMHGLIKRYPNISMARHYVPNTDMSIDWLTVVGKDCVVGHPEKCSRTSGAALRAYEEFIHEQSQHLGIDYHNIRLLCMGHTHQLSWLPWRSGSVLVETGTLAKSQEYQVSPRIGGRPQRRGYCTFTQYSGRTDLNSLNIHWFDVEDDAPWQT